MRRKNMVNKKELTFTLFNKGNAFNFNPFKDIICPYEKRKRSQLDFYRDFVTFHNAPTTFIVDNTGRILVG